MPQSLTALQQLLDGELFYDNLHKIIYATDASVYREMPLAVCYPKSTTDLITLTQFANKNKVGLIPRTAGTSLAGQCVGKGIVVDVSKYLAKIIELNTNEGWVKVQPGIIRDELNSYLKPFGYFFAPNTSTSNRCMIGGMVGNNSCGTTSIKYGDTRAHVLEIEAVLSDGSLVTFENLSKDEFEEKCKLNNLEGNIYKGFKNLLADSEIRAEIIRQFPKPSVSRRNTGYALDELCKTNIFEGSKPFNFCNLLAGSEGTLAFFATIKLKLTPLPPNNKAVICAHFYTIDEALKATVLAMECQPDKVEMMDDTILNCTKGLPKYEALRFFVEQNPKAIIIVEFAKETVQQLNQAIDKLIGYWQQNNLGYAYPIIKGSNIDKVWNLRKAGLGLLGNLPGDAKAVSVIEDTAVDVKDLPDYIAEFQLLLKKHDLTSVFHAHAGAGELHLRPILNLKEKNDRLLFRKIAEETASLVKKYKGSNSGEHGDGRLRGEFIQSLVGEKVYHLFKEVKNIWDANHIFNPGKIVDTPPMDEFLRYKTNQQTKQFKTQFDFNESGGILRLAEKCNGAGDCRKLHTSGGTMCPSYMAFLNEKDTTRARANVLREIMTQSENPFESQDLLEVLDLCLSCKGCSSECPSKVDMALLKAEVTYQHYSKKGFPLRSKIFANLNDINQLNSKINWLINPLLNNNLSGPVIKKVLGVAPKRSLPKVKPSLTNWINKNQNLLNPPKAAKGEVYLFIDEFTNYLDIEIGEKAIELLNQLGYKIKHVKHDESGRAAFSKGMLLKAKKHANNNVKIFKDLITATSPLIGIEPSAILSFVDEYPKIVDENLKPDAQKIAQHCLTIEGFLFSQIKKGILKPEDFSTEEKHIKLHGHCHQKALTPIEESIEVLGFPKNFHVEYIPSGCCGMAGSFGYEKEHYEISMQIGELVLFPAVKSAHANQIIVAAGTSCRHQIFDGTGKKALHPVEVLLS